MMISDCTACRREQNSEISATFASFVSSFSTFAFQPMALCLSRTASSRAHHPVSHDSASLVMDTSAPPCNAHRASPAIGIQDLYEIPPRGRQRPSFLPKARVRDEEPGLRRRLGPRGPQPGGRRFGSCRPAATTRLRRGPDATLYRRRGMGRHRPEPPDQRRDEPLVVGDVQGEECVDASALPTRRPRARPMSAGRATGTPTRLGAATSATDVALECPIQSAR
jgi:hypothetical protein